MQTLPQGTERTEIDRLARSQRLKKSPNSRTPKQQRSRESFDRVIAATIELLEEGSYAALTLAAVSRRAKVSIGSIYCRVDGKDALLREVQAVVMQQMEREFALLISRVRRRQLPLAELVPGLIREVALYLRRHANVLAAFMQAGDHDPIVEEVGRRAFQQAQLDFKLLLLERAAEFRHPEPDHAAEACFTVTYAVLGRYLGLNAGAPGHHGAGEGDWSQLVDDLGLMCLAFAMLDIPTVGRALGGATTGRPGTDPGHSAADTVFASRPWSGKGM